MTRLALDCLRGVGSRNAKVWYLFGLAKQQLFFQTNQQSRPLSCLPEAESLHNLTHSSLLIRAYVFIFYIAFVRIRNRYLSILRTSNEDIKHQYIFFMNFHLYYDI